MYAAQPNGADSGTINPAALASDLADVGSRGIKRSRSPDHYQETNQPGSAGDDGDKPRKRGRPMKTKPVSETPIPPPTVPPMAQANAPPQTPQSQSAPLPPVAHQQVPYAAPASAAGAGAAPATAVTQASPQAKTTPTKSTLKALPTVRDHTTDQLGPGGDEYLPREIDEAGEKKVMPNGQLLGGREYRCRTFLVPNRGEKLFMLATECARILNYRDSYLLFNKNRSLFKIIANQVEKDDLVAQEILPFSYRSRQIAIVTARSMFRQFGSRVIVNGRRVRDDYWETKARKQGFTEADLAGEKRPGAAKAREAADAGGHPTALLGAPHGEIVYSNPPGHFAGPQPQIVQPGVDYHDRRTEYNGIMKGVPRQEMSGQPYTDRTQPTPIAELNAQAHHTAEYNRSVNQNREVRADYLQTQWRRPHEQPASAALAQPTGTSESSIAASSRTAAAPHSGSTGLQQPNMVPNQSPQMLMTGPPYSQPISAQTTLQSSMRGSQGNLSQPQGYSYGPSTQMWQQTPQAQQYGYTHSTQAQASPHQQPSSAAPMRHSGISAQVQPGSMPYTGMPGMNQGYAAQGQNMTYDQTPRQYMSQSGAAAPAVTQGWSGQQQQAPAWWANQQQ